MRTLAIVLLLLAVPVAAADGPPTADDTATIGGVAVGRGAACGVSKYRVGAVADTVARMIIVLAKTPAERDKAQAKSQLALKYGYDEQLRQPGTCAEGLKMFNELEALYRRRGFMQ